MKRAEFSSTAEAKAEVTYAFAKHRCSADFTICMCEFDYRQAHDPSMDELDDSEVLRTFGVVGNLMNTRVNAKKNGPDREAIFTIINLHR